MSNRESIWSTRFGSARSTVRGPDHTSTSTDKQRYLWGMESTNPDPLDDDCLVEVYDLAEGVTTP